MARLFQASVKSGCDLNSAEKVSWLGFGFGFGLSFRVSFGPGFGLGLGSGPGQRSMPQYSPARSPSHSPPFARRLSSGRRRPRGRQSGASAPRATAAPSIGHGEFSLSS